MHLLLGAGGCGGHGTPCSPHIPHLPPGSRQGAPGEEGRPLLGAGAPQELEQDLDVGARHGLFPFFLGGFGVQELGGLAPALPSCPRTRLLGGFIGFRALGSHVCWKPKPWWSPSPAPLRPWPRLAGLEQPMAP